MLLDNNVVNGVEQPHNELFNNNAVTGQANTCHTRRACTVVELPSTPTLLCGHGSAVHPSDLHT